MLLHLPERKSKCGYDNLLPFLGKCQGSFSQVSGGERGKVKWKVISVGYLDLGKAEEKSEMKQRALSSWCQRIGIPQETLGEENRMGGLAPPPLPHNWKENAS